MRIEIGRNIEKYIKSRIKRFFINQDDFTIVSNNCWGTFIYKKFGLPYNSPFVNMFIFSPDYIELLENFSFEILKKLSFIDRENSKYKEELIKLGFYDLKYPIGILDNRYEIHFLHYKFEEDARDKWMSRLQRMNFDKLIFKFSEDYNFENAMAKQFDDLNFKNKICFTTKKHDSLKSIISLKKFLGTDKVYDEWKHSDKEFDDIKFINNLQVG